MAIASRNGLRTPVLISLRLSTTYTLFRKRGILPWPISRISKKGYYSSSLFTPNIAPPTLLHSPAQTTPCPCPCPALDLSLPPEEENPISESIIYLLSRILIWKRWTENYNQRTSIRINLFFNLANQSDSRTNLEIADLTAKIAIDTQKDSSSMITWVVYPFVIFVEDG